jgi:tetratricopeptide (TPR) repeat protein
LGAALRSSAAHGSTAARAKPARGHLHEARRAVANEPDTVIALRLPALLYLSFGLLGLGELEMALAEAERGLKILHATGQAHLFVPFTVLTSLSKLASGRLHEARADADAASNAAASVGIDQLVIWSATAESEVAFAAGDIPAALASAQRAVTALERAPTTVFGWRARLAQAIARAEIGDHGWAIAVICDQLREDRPVSVTADARPRCYRLLAAAEIALGRLQRASGWVQRAQRTATQLRITHAQADADAAAALELARGRAPQAATLAFASAEAFALAGRHVEAARSRLLLGRAF